VLNEIYRLISKEWMIYFLEIDGLDPRSQLAMMKIRRARPNQEREWLLSLEMERKVKVPMIYSTTSIKRQTGNNSR